MTKALGKICAGTSTTKENQKTFQIVAVVCHLHGRDFFPKTTFIVLTLRVVYLYKQNCIIFFVFLMLQKGHPTQY